MTYSFAKIGCRDGASANYSEATIFGSDREALVALGESPGRAFSRFFLDSICRPTLQVENVSHRKMMTSAGIRYRKPRVSKATGMGRSNCPKCGRLTWSYNTYDDGYCDDHRMY